ncbi:uncharacterized protein N7479_005501 [Penicillium vulpinum]|uniref:uncharacterized protein n=1 Tax=Penicillium vulpinum TaxID=29845 RepID=UPI00254958CD|nr:uncharacterized protein N7479_005501 [Penicillium vulpinum]KAJ5958351.1 hypothetical protein N7479_005501 [Penicillium vulpinum]
MASNKPVDKLADNLKGLVIGASGTIPGYQHVDRVRELEGCEIVNIDWLLQKIEKVVPESVRKQIFKEENNGTEGKGKKRERESSIEDDKVSSWKKAKDEEQINLKNLIELVDEKYPEPSSTLSVWQDVTGLIWDATLVRARLKKQVQVLRIQLLVHRELQTFHTWDLQCQFGSSEASKSVGAMGSFDSAKHTFEEKFKSLSGLAWEDRNAIPSSKGWFVLEMHHRDVPVFTSEISLLPTSIENVLKIIFTSGTFKGYLNLLNRLGRNILVANKVDKKRLVFGIAVLGKLMELTNPELAPGDHSQAKKSLCRIYESLILKTGFLSDANDTIRKELESLDLLLMLHDASEILERKFQSSSLAMSQISQVLGLAKLLPVKEDSTEFEMLREYLEKTSSPNHAYQFEASYEVIGVFRIERPGEAERFAEWEKANLADVGDRRLLWHGSMASNFAGILSQGLRGDGIVSTDGKHFVPGVFFADISTKSAGYCRQKGEALMLLCEVELGKSSTLSHHHAGGTIHKKWRDAGYIHPDFKGTQVPDVHAGTKSSSSHSGLYNSEYVAHTPAQIRQRYLFHVKIV